MGAWRLDVPGRLGAEGHAERWPAYLFLACGAALAAFAWPRAPVAAVFLGVAGGLVALVVLSLGRAAADWLRAAHVSRGHRERLGGTPGIAVLTDRRGRCLAFNAGADRRAGAVRQGPVERLLAAFSADPEALAARLSRKALRDGAAFEALGAQPGGARLRVVRLARDRLLWSLGETSADPDLPLLFVGSGRVEVNAAARRLIGEGARSLSDIVLDLPLRQAGRHRLRGSDGKPFEARLVELRRFGDAAEIAILPLGAEGAAPAPAEAALGRADVLDALPVPMIKLAADGQVLQANAEARAILSLEGAALPPLFELVEGMGRPITDWLADAAAGRGLLKPEIVRAAVPGQELFLQITLGRAVEEGRVVLVGILNDATELKTLEAQFVQSQKMQAIGQLAGGVAHDFNNLLTAISGHCDLLLLRHEASDPEYADLIQISQNANRAASLVGQLLAFSRKQNLKPQALDLRDTMVDLVHLLNRLIGERIRLEVTHAPGPQMIRADRRQLEQVIVNLVVNARDAMPEGGRIRVQTRTEVLSEEVLRDRATLTPGEYVVIEVSDDGIGIPAESLVKIFEPFYTTKKTGEGTGLGLSTAYGIVKQTGGFIFVDSTLGEGTVFSLYFPACGQVVEAPAEPPAGKPARSPRRMEAAILLVEDEGPVRAFASRALRLRGYTVIEAENAEAALAILKDRALAIDLFVTDVIMPGMDGPTWVRAALKHRPDTPVIFMSGYAEEARAEKQARIPNSDFLPKPFSLQQLTALVQEKLA